MSYYDIDAILTDAQKVPTKFNLDVPHLSHLDSTHPSHTGGSAVLKKHTILSLPLWLAEILAVAETTPPLVTLDLPDALAPRVLHALQAGPASVDLRALASHHYALGARVLELFEEEDILAVLVESWRARAELLADFAARGAGGAASSSSSSSGAAAGGARKAGADASAGGSGAVGAGMGAESTEFMRGLDEWERGLWAKSFEGGKRVRLWMAEVRKS